LRFIELRAPRPSLDDCSQIRPWPTDGADSDGHDLGVDFQALSRALRREARA